MPDEIPVLNVLINSVSVPVVLAPGPVGPLGVLGVG